MPNDKELKGVLFFSDREPQITGYLVIDGIEYELAGWHANKVRAELKARRRDGEPEQLDMIE